MANASRHVASNTAAIAYAAATAKTALTIYPSQYAVRLVEMGISFSGTDTTVAPALVELLRTASNVPGSGTTPSNVDRYFDSGTGISFGGYARESYTTEPTYALPKGRWYVHPASGLLVMQWAPGEGPTCPISQGIGLRVNSPAAVSGHAYIVFDEILGT